MAKMFYSRIDGTGKEIESKTIDPRACPHLILIGEHYRTDGSCRCDDIDNPEMIEWGYVWNPVAHRWDAE